MSDRFSDLRRLYAVLDRLRSMVGTRVLAESTGALNWPKRGVYFFFEPREDRSDSGGGLRVVRVGTHALTRTSKTTLWNRLSQHRGSITSGGGNHRGSIFRLLIGEALAGQSPELKTPTWGKGNSANAEVRATERDLESRVSAYLRTMPFLWLKVGDDPAGGSQRGYIERNTIALLSTYAAPSLDPPSRTWLGQFSPRDKVRRSGLWNQDHVDEAYDPNFLQELERLVSLAQRSR